MAHVNVRHFVITVEQASRWFPDHERDDFIGLPAIARATWSEEPPGVFTTRNGIKVRVAGPCTADVLCGWNS